MKKIVVLHLHYLEVWRSISKYISVIDPDEIHITTTRMSEACKMILKDFPQANIYDLPNQGRDIYPLLFLSRMNIFDEDAVVWKLHSKRSLHTLRGDNWRNEMINAIAGNSRRVSLIESAIGKKESSMIGSQKYLTQISEYNLSDHYSRYRTWCEDIGLDFFENVNYFSGTIFACHSQLLARIKFIPPDHIIFQSESMEKPFKPGFAIKLYILNTFLRGPLFKYAYLKMDSKTRPASKDTYAFEGFFGVLALNYHGILGLE